MWKDVSVRLILKDKGGNQYCLPFCWFYSEGWDILEKKGVTGKGCLEIEDWDASAQLH